MGKKRKHRSCSSDDERRKRSRSSSLSTSSSPGLVPREVDRQESTERKEKKKAKKKKAKKEHKKCKKKHKTKHGRHSSPECFGPSPPTASSSSSGISESRVPDRVVDKAGPRNERLMVPMTKEEWEKERNTIRHVFDPETGRNRLVRGNGEILEEIVSKKRHAEINKQATVGDGIFYQLKAGLGKKTK